MTGRPHPLIPLAARATTQPAGSPIDVSHRCARPPASSGSSVSLLPAHAHTTVTSLFFFFFLSTERIDASYFKAPLATSKSRQTTSEGAWALFISRCRYADDEYSNQFNISFAIVDIKCAQIYNKFKAKGIYCVCIYLHAQNISNTFCTCLWHYSFSGCMYKLLLSIRHNFTDRNTFKVLLLTYVSANVNMRK